jgi:hypothetical protein
MLGFRGIHPPSREQKFDGHVIGNAPPQSASEFWPAAAAFRSQPGEKNRSPAPVMMAILRDGSSRNSVTTALRRRLAARSMALALGRSMVISRTSPALTVVTPSDMCAPLYMYRCGLIISSAS